MDEHVIRAAVRRRYGQAATAGGSCCGDGVVLGEDAADTSGSTCCGGAPVKILAGGEVADDLLGPALGCGTPVEAATLRPGETVVDLGSGAGRDVVLAAERVGPAGRAIGVDMTPEMVAKARRAAAALGIPNAEFLLGEIEHLPLPDGIADAAISNCVINLLPDKRPAFAEAFRVLRPGGRLVISDIVSRRPLPEAFKNEATWAACLAGAIPESDYVSQVRAAGFTDVQVLARRPYAGGDLFSITLRAKKPAGSRDP
jgi:SAM-dependent methyltransferase